MGRNGGGGVGIAASVGACHIGYAERFVRRAEEVVHKFGGGKVVSTVLDGTWVEAGMLRHLEGKWLPMGSGGYAPAPRG